jgi:hypothetical protein
MTFVIMTEFLHMSKELNDLSDHVLSHWFPMWKDFPRKYEQEDHAVKEAFEGQPNQMKMWSSPRPIWEGNL